MGRGTLTVPYIYDLISEARRGDLIAAEEVFDFLEFALEHPGRSVGAAFGLVQRGGDQRRHFRAERDRLIRASALRLPATMPVEQKLRAIQGDSELLRNIETIGLGVPGPRQLRNIIEEKRTTV